MIFSSTWVFHMAVRSIIDQVAQDVASMEEPNDAEGQATMDEPTEGAQVEES